MVSRSRKVTVSLKFAPLLAQRVEINRHAKRRARLVLPPVTPANGPRFIIKYRHVRTQANPALPAPFLTSSGLFLSSGNTATLTGAMRG